MKHLLSSTAFKSFAFSGMTLAFVACGYDIPQTSTSSNQGGAGGADVSSSSHSSSSGSNQASSSGNTSSSSSGAPMQDICGDGIMTGTEACDDGNMRTGDGCNNNCEIENHDTCDVSGMSIGKDSIIIRGTTAGSIDDIKTTAMVDGCNAATWPGGDLVYIVKPLFAGNLTVTLEAKYAVHLLHIRTACPGGESDEIGCQHGALATAADVSTVSVDAGNVYYIIVDSYAGTSGPFVLTLSLQ